jgi:hypothetical protein
VTVIEARDRIGGRVYTRNQFDYGAHWILGGWEQLMLYRVGCGALSAEEKLRSILRADEIREAIDDWRRQQSLARKYDEMPFGAAAHSLIETKASA